MIIWLDADSLPRKVRDIVARAACREEVEAVFVANRGIPFEECPSARMLVTPEGITADDYILQNAAAYDLAVTRDIPLASQLLEKDVAVINDRGNRFDRDSIAERLSQREWTLQLKEAGVAGPGGRSYDVKDVKRFADRFDREFRRLLLS